MTAALRIQVWKEFRALAPWWAGTLFTVVVATLIGLRQPDHSRANSLFMAAMFAHIAGCAALGALSMGQEYSYRTLGALLAFPVSRRQVLTLKSAVLGGLIAALLIVSMATFQAVQIFPVYRDPSALRTVVFAPAIAGLFLAPWLTMLCRASLAGAVFSIAIPVLLAMLCNAFDLGVTPAWLMFGGLAAAGALMTWVTFIRLPVVDGPQETAGGTALFERPMPVDKIDSGPHAHGNWVWPALQKELRLQYMTFTLTGLYVALWTLTVLARKADPNNLYVGPSHFALTSLHGAVVALLAGAIPVAEERRYATAEWQMLLPVFARKQWTLKFVTAISVALLLSIAVPVVLKLIHWSVDDLSFDEQHVWGVSLLTVVGLYVSSFSTTGLRALLASLPLMAAATLVLTVVSQPLTNGVQHLISPLASSLIQPGTFEPRSYWPLLNSVMAPLIAGFAAVLLSFGLANYRSADLNRGRIARQLFWLFVYAAVAIGVVAVAEVFITAGLPGHLLTR